MHIGSTDPKAMEHPGRNAFLRLEQAEQEVLRANVVVLEPDRFFLRQHQRPAGTVGETVKAIGHTWPCIMLPGDGVGDGGGTVSPRSTAAASS